MATAGSGDILTGLIAGFLGQFPDQAETAVAAAMIYLHGLAGELGASAKSEKSLIATDLLDYLPAAMHACPKPFSHILKRKRSRSVSGWRGYCHQGW